MGLESETLILDQFSKERQSTPRLPPEAKHKSSVLERISYRSPQDFHRLISNLHELTIEVQQTHWEISNQENQRKSPTT